MSDDTMELEELTPTESPSDNKQPEDDTAPEEWQTLDGRSQDRFKKLAQQKRELLIEKQQLQADLEAAKRSSFVPMPKAGGDQPDMSSDEKVAFNRLKELGMPDRAEVDRQIKEEVENVKSRLYVDNLHDKLESEVGREKGLPGYDRVEIEDYMRKNQIWNPKTAYNELYHDEIVAHEAQRLISKKKEVTQPEKTKSRIGSSQPWTRESLAERLRQPDGIEFFRKNREKILRMQTDLGE